jgi:hypothetical protein
MDSLTILRDERYAKCEIDHIFDGVYTGIVSSDPVDLKFTRGASVTAQWTNDTTAGKTFVAGTSAIWKATYPAVADAVDGDYFTILSKAGVLYAIAIDKTGSSAAPTGAVWMGIPAAQKAQCDISGCTDAASVAAAMELAFDGLTGITSIITTSDGANDGTMLFTQVVRGDVGAANMVTYLKNDAGPSVEVLVAEDTAGVDSTVDVTANTIKIVGHTFATGLKGQVTKSGAAFPGAILGTTDYFAIVLDEDTIQLAVSHANALAGTALNITDQGTNATTFTFTPTALAGSKIELWEVNDLADTWNVIASSSTNITTTGNMIKVYTGFESRYLKAIFTSTAGQVGLNCKVCYKEGI